MLAHTPVSESMTKSSDPAPCNSKEICAFERMSASDAETCRMSLPAGEFSGTLSLYSA